MTNEQLNQLRRDLENSLDTYYSRNDPGCGELELLRARNERLREGLVNLAMALLNNGVLNINEVSEL